MSRRRRWRGRLSGVITRIAMRLPSRRGAHRLMAQRWFFYFACVYYFIVVFGVVCERWQNTWSNLLEEGVLGRRDGWKLGLCVFQGFSYTIYTCVMNIFLLLLWLMAESKVLAIAV